MIVGKEPGQNGDIWIRAQRCPQPFNIVLLPTPLRDVVVKSHEKEGVETHGSMQSGVSCCVPKCINLPANSGYKAQLLMQECVPASMVRVKA